MPVGTGSRIGRFCSRLGGFEQEPTTLLARHSPSRSAMNDLRHLCIRTMASIYKGAAAVLVLSSTIRKVATTDNDAERGLVFYLANWNSRLWTFQEDVLAEKLLLQFSDKVLAYDEVAYPRISTSITRGHCVTIPGRVQRDHGWVTPFVTFCEMDFSKDWVPRRAEGALWLLLHLKFSSRPFRRRRLEAV
jgi:hypothetical protein